MRVVPRAGALLFLVALGPLGAWGEEGSTSRGALTGSVEVMVPGAFVRTSPSVNGSKRGTLARGARLPALEATEAEGCDRLWYRIGKEAWVCGGSLARRLAAPEADRLPVVVEGDLVPYSYGFAGQDGARLYRSLADVEYDEWEREFDPSSGLHLMAKLTHEGRRYYQLVDGGYVPMADVRPARLSDFSGQHLEPGQLGGWVTSRSAAVRSLPGRGRVLRRLRRRSGLIILERTQFGRATWVRVGPDEWVDERGVTVMELAEPPQVVGPEERWIHVDRERQILTAYEGSTPRYATLVSTGRHGTATPAGIFRIWAKLATGTMSDEGESIDDNPYEMRGVPWVMYFNEGVALHGAYWHDDFGRRRSHGCVNLAPVDAAFLFNWTSPTLPPGWTGVLPARSDPGTIVVVE